MSKNNNNNISYIFFVIAICIVLYTMIKIIMPFSMVIFFASVFYIILNPLYVKILGKSYNDDKRLSKIKKIILAVIFSFVSLIIFLIPTVLLGYAIIGQLIELSDVGINYFLKLDIKSLIKTLSQNPTFSNLPFNISFENIITTLQNSALSSLSSLSKYITQNIATVLKSTGGFATNFIFMMFSLFFFFVDGKYLKEQIETVMPIERKYTERLFKKAGDGVKGIIYGNLFTGIFQAFCGFVVFLAFRIDNALILSSLIVFASFIPIIGTGIIWVPVGILLIINKSLITGILFLVISAVAITVPDNFVRPILLGGRIELHPLFIFFAILGGIITFGLAGIIIGPLFFIVFFESMKIFNEVKMSNNKRYVRRRGKY